ncbi:Clp protease N-terminal domain-containing protein [Nonomuraea endophytica]|uniref:D-alanyl-D-alanine carboxypeptidase n=1 Tax=Nonomuraea endophytica TaxID=714136 RepID=A0A7W8A8Q3_9ACTN|nr:Clp protease N-terminal domain-containing protein [Nonomuraea endophytica]MBB5081628.1 D-alanyl-D-alanine carboxypeptidase [Nonomuraea endophytica]
MTQGEHEARQDHSATIEAHHLLLAIADHQGATAGRLLSEVGLDRSGVRAALDREFEHSLTAAGVSAAFHLPPAGRRPKPPGIGASAKLALERAFTAVRKKDVDSAHLLAGILRARVGTVPRALALAGVDREALLTRTQTA